MNLPQEILCEICEEGRTHLCVTHNEIEIAGIAQSVPMYFYACYTCGSEMAGADCVYYNAELIRGIHERVLKLVK